MMYVMPNSTASDAAPESAQSDFPHSLLGFGNVGVATARLMRAFGMKIHAINRRGASHEPTDWIATTDLLDEMLRVADVLVISAALTTATEGLIGARELGLMKENAILINVARWRDHR